MIAVMEHRGPDTSAAFTQGRYSLGMTRLSIQDLSAAGDQPMATPDRKIWMVYNGEMYNADEQRELLEERGYRFRSHSERTVLPEFGAFSRVRYLISGHLRRRRKLSSLGTRLG